jgi:hypothetical protein
MIAPGGQVSGEFAGGALTLNNASVGSTHSEEA